MTQFREGLPHRASVPPQAASDSVWPPGDSSLLQELEAYAAAVQQGEYPDREGLLAKHPKLAEELAEFLDGLELIRWLGPPLEDGEPKTRSTLHVSDSLPHLGRLGDFRLVRQIGRGGMGVVYEAEQISLHRRVALKVLPFVAMLDQKHLQRFRNEAQAAASLDHPNVVHVYSIGCERAVHFYAMQYVEGSTLAQVIRELQKLPDETKKRKSKSKDQLSAAARSLLREAAGDSENKWDEKESSPGSGDDMPGTDSPSAETEGHLRGSTTMAISTERPQYYRTVVRLGIQAAEALQHAHDLGVVHRDIKPSNLMVDTRGHLWITDFGLAQTQGGANITMTGDVLGTLRYMSPEQAQGDHGVMDHRTDIYSLGVTLYEVLTLRPAFPEEDRQRLLRRVVQEEPLRPRQVERLIPHDLETIILKAMSKEPQARYRTARQLADDLQRFFEHKPIHARRPSVAARAMKWSHRHRATVAWSSALLVMAAVAAGLLAWDRHQRRLSLDTDVGKNLAAAQAFMQSRDFAAVEKELAEARARIDTAGYSAAPLVAAMDRLSGELSAKRHAERQFERFQELRQAVHSQVYDVAPSARDGARSNCVECLEKYGVLETDRWREAAAFENLDSKRREDLEEGIAELLLMLARLEARQNQLDPAPKSEPYRAWHFGYRMAKVKNLDAAERAAGYRRALTALERIESFRGPSPAVSLWMAEFLDALGEEALARKQEERSSERASVTSLDHFATGEYHAAHQEWDAALDSYWLAIQLQPNHSLSFLASGIILADLQGDELATAMLTGAIALSPRITLAYVERGECYLRQGKSELAEADFATAMKLDPNLAKEFTARAISYRNHEDWDRTVVECTRAIRLDTELAISYAVRGFAHLRKGDWDRAIADYTEAIRCDPKFANAYSERALAFAENGELASALADADEAIRIDPDNAGAYCNRGLIHKDLGKIDKALEDCSQCIRLAPNDPLAYYNRGLAYRQRANSTNRADLALAVKDFSKALELFPDWGVAYSQRGWAHLLLGDNDRAIADFGEMLRLDRRHVSSYKGRAEAYFRERDYEKAIADFSEVIQRQPKDTETYLNRSLAHRKTGNLEAAMSDLSNVVQIDPKDAKAYSNRADIHYKMGNLEAAMSDLSKVVQIDPENARAYFNRSVIHYELGNLEAAMSDLSKVVQIDPENAEAYSNRADIHYKMENLEGAMSDYNAVIRIDPQDAEVYSNRADIHYKMGDIEAAMSDYNAVIRIDPQNAEAYSNRADIHCKKGDIEAAMSDLNEAIRLNPSLTGAYIDRGTLFCDHRGELDKAIADFDKAIQLDPKSAVAHLNRAIAYARVSNYADRAKLTQAVKDYGRAIELDPSYVKAYLGRGILFLQGLGELDKAVADFSEAIRLEPRDASAYTVRGEALMKSGELDKALTDFSNAIRLRPEFTRAHLNRASIFSRKGNLDEALTDFRAAVRLDARTKAELVEHWVQHSGEDAKGCRNWFLLTIAYWHEGHMEKARACYKKAIAWMNEHDPDDERLMLLCGIAKRVLGIEEDLTEEGETAPRGNKAGKSEASE